MVFDNNKTEHTFVIAQKNKNFDFDISKKELIIMKKFLREHCEQTVFFDYIRELSRKNVISENQNFDIFEKMHGTGTICNNINHKNRLSFIEFDEMGATIAILWHKIRMHEKITAYLSNPNLYFFYFLMIMDSFCVFLHDAIPMTHHPLPIIKTIERLRV